MMAVSDRKILSTGEILQVAKARFLQLSSQHRIDLSKLKHFFDASHFNLSGDEIKDVELVLLLFASAHKFASQQIDQSIKFLSWCRFLSSPSGSPAQRLVHFFTKSLQERIDGEIGATKEEEQGQSDQSQTTPPCANPALIACSLKLPYIQVTQFAGIQTVIESVASARKVHFIDLAIRSGGQCTVLMQALANRQGAPIELLTVTAVATAGESWQQRIQETGKRLASFAEALNIPFRFNCLMVDGIRDLKEDMFEIGRGDTAVAVFAWNILKNFRAQAEGLDSLCGVLRNLNPCAIVVAEFEANHDATEFFELFDGAIALYGALFDCLDDCFDRSDGDRGIVESAVGIEIRDAVAVEGDQERVYRPMRIEEWRDYFSRVGMMELEISSSSFYQAALLVRNFASGESCTVDRDGKCLVTGWKGTPLLSVSAWKFYRPVKRRLNPKRFA
ncbi:unnamed protein product [Linum trigynum]|uniref:Uncharacterized protein n=1 Tax=Linum trigynum TaxID=586398 RepID=A0AAV2GSK1_9ROSI